jgi:hypothetical protein
MDQPIVSHTNKCSFCRSENHFINTCLLAYQGAQILHNSILKIINETIINSSSSIFLTLKDYLKLHTIKELKLLVRMHNVDIITFTRNLLVNNLFNIHERSLFLKGELVKILTLYYFSKVDIQQPTKKFYILSLIKNNIENKELQCPICLDNKENIECVSLNCNHNLCYSCLEMYLENLCREKTPCCSLCREPIKKVTFTNVEQRDKLRNNLIT